MNTGKVWPEKPLQRNRLASLFSRTNYFSHNFHAQPSFNALFWPPSQQACDSNPVNIFHSTNLGLASCMFNTELQPCMAYVNTQWSYSHFTFVGILFKKIIPKREDMWKSLGRLLLYTWRVEAHSGIYSGVQADPLSFTWVTLYFSAKTNAFSDPRAMLLKIRIAIWPYDFPVLNK